MVKPLSMLGMSRAIWLGCERNETAIACLRPLSSSDVFGFMGFVILNFTIAPTSVNGCRFERPSLKQLFDVHVRRFDLFIGRCHFREGSLHRDTLVRFRNPTPKIVSD